MKLTVTTVSKKEQALATAPAAIYVISQEDIRRSGVTSVAEALRLAPGVQVAQISSSDWGVSVRGYNTRFSNKLLVLVDGRTVYTPSFSGVFWAEQDLLLEDIDRIEVIRGPGATLWGANAVNGVINIITRPAAETTGVLIGAAGGTSDPAAAYVRYGGRAGNRGHYRVYGRHARRGDLATDRNDAGDGWKSSRGGFRADWLWTPADAVTVQGEAYQALPHAGLALVAAAPFPGLASSRGANLLGRWTRTLAGGSEVSAQLYFDDARQGFFGVMDLRHDTFDVDIQHNWRAGERHAIVWSAGYRNLRQRTWGTPWVHWNPPARTLRVFSGLAQDEITLSRSATLTLGSKFESNSFSGVSVQPSVRLLFAPTARHTWWAAVSRAARSPNELEAEGELLLPGFATPWGVPLAVTLNGNPHPRSEELLACEAGYRTAASRRLMLDFAGFYNRYQHMASFELAAGVPPSPQLVALSVANHLAGRTYGLEATATYAPFGRWKLSGSYAWLRMSVSGAAGLPGYSQPGDNPEHQIQAHSLLSLPRGLELDGHLWFVSALPQARIPRYTRLDVRLGWRPNPHLEWSIAGQNLGDNAHPEFFTGLQPAPLEVRRSFYGKLVWRF